MPTIKIATYNLNNLFERVKVLELEGFSNEAKQILQDVKQLNELLEKESYDGPIGQKILGLLTKYFFEKKAGKYVAKKNPYIFITEIKEKLYSVSKDGSGPKLKANGRTDWFGWVEFRKSNTNDIALLNTGRVLNEVRADIVCCVEVDNRIALKRFSEEVMKKEYGFHYSCPMLIDGNDERGIDVGVLTNFAIGKMISHVNDGINETNKHPVFSRDCPEYEIILNKDTSLYLLCNHFKSKGYGLPEASNKKRKLQADKVVDILSKYNLTKDYVVVAGDFNDTPDSEPLKNLLSIANLHDVLNSPLYSGDKSTYHTGNDQIDYLLVSAPIWNALQSVGIERRGIFKKGTDHFPQVTGKANQASDHACVWATFDI